MEWKLNKRTQREDDVRTFSAMNQVVGWQFHSMMFGIEMQERK